MAVEPKEAQCSTGQRGAKYGQLADAREIEEPQVVGGVDTPDQIGEDAERAAGDRGESGRETVEPIREVHRVRAATYHESDERDEERRPDHQPPFLEEGQRGVIHRIVAERILPEQITQ